MRILSCLALLVLAACAEPSARSHAYTNYTGYDCYTDAMRDLDTQMAVNKPL